MMLCVLICLIFFLCSLLTSFTFMKLSNMYFSGIDGACKHLGILYGLGVDGDNAKAGFMD